MKARKKKKSRGLWETEDSVLRPIFALKLSHQENGRKETGFLYLIGKWGGQKVMVILEAIGLPCGSDCKESACIMGDLGSIPGLGRFPREVNDLPLRGTYYFIF